jgi:hypothetical protein
MKVVYIVNESPFYMVLVYFSLISLRRYNPKIPVEILCIRDKNQHSRQISGYKEKKLGVPWFNFSQFVHECSKMNVIFNIVEDLDMGEEQGFTPIQRKEFVRVDGENILLLDADTFIFADITSLFDSYKNYDIVGDKNNMKKNGVNLPICEKHFYPFNSGVILFRNGTFQEYGRKVYDLCVNIKRENHSVGKYFSNLANKINESVVKCMGFREELAFTTFVIENNFKSTYFDSTEVQTYKLNGPTKIFHTITPNWYATWLKFHRAGKWHGPKKIKCKFFNR